MTAQLDGQILHALQLSPRVSFRRIGDVVGAPEQTVARRYRKLLGDGVVRVIGLPSPRVHGEARWVVRVRAKPDDLPRLAGALVRRPEVTHANLLSGGTELVCVIRAPLADGSDGLLHRLPRTTTVLGLDTALILHDFDERTTAPWTAHGGKLTAAQIGRILEGPEHDSSLEPTSPTTATTPTDEDRILFDALADDGRAPHARLAELTGWSAARVKRRTAALEAAGTLIYDVDLLPERLGFDINATLWLTAAPRDVHRVGTQIAAHDEIVSAAATSGRHNLLAIAICRDVDHLYRYLADKLSTIDGIQTYDVGIRTQRLKQAASLISHGRLVQAGRTS